jgi:hypothetical protein
VRLNEYRREIAAQARSRRLGELNQRVDEGLAMRREDASSREREAADKAAAAAAAERRRREAESQEKQTPPSSRSSSAVSLLRSSLGMSGKARASTETPRQQSSSPKEGDAPDSARQTPPASRSSSVASLLRNSLRASFGRTGSARSRQSTGDASTSPSSARSRSRAATGEGGELQPPSEEEIPRVQEAGGEGTNAALGVTLTRALSSVQEGQEEK